MADDEVSQLKHLGKRIYLIITTLPGLCVLLILFNILGALVFQHLDKSEYQDLEFWESLFFCVTMFTTIGYGHMSARTDGSKICVIVYCIIGVPLAFTVFARTGKMVTRLLQIICQQIQLIFCKRQNYGYVVQNQGKTKPNIEDENNDGIARSNTQTDPKKSNHEFELPVFVPILILFIYMLLGAMMYSLLEDWKYLDSIYFVFVSLSTIGFGDIIPSNDRFFLETSFFVIIGLILVSTCINTAVSKRKHPVQVTGN